MIIVKGCRRCAAPRAPRLNGVPGRPTGAPSLTPSLRSCRSGPPTRRDMRLAIIVSHPIQYVAPLYQRLARRDDIAVKVFFTWHAGQAPVQDHGFGLPVAW